MSIRTLVPCIITIFLAVIAFTALQTAPPSDPFHEWITQIEDGENIEEAYKAAQDYLKFSGEALGGQSTPDAMRQLADRHFLLGQAMFAKKTPDGLKNADQQFLKAVQYYPSLRHGWPYFLGAEALEQLGDNDRAIEWYQQAAEHDYGQLAVNAHYRTALVKICQPTPPSLDPRPVYHFLRFVSSDPVHDMATFQGVSWNQRPEAMYLRALTALNNVDAEEAVSILEGYLRIRPEDPSAQYQLDSILNWRREGSYPADGDLLTSYLAPRSFNDNGPVLLNNTELMTNAYFHFPPQQVELNLEFVQHDGAAVTWTITFNGESQTIKSPVLKQTSDSPAVKQSKINAVFSNVQQRNLIQVQPTLETLSSDETQNRLRLLKLTLLSSEESSTNSTEPSN